MVSNEAPIGRPGARPPLASPGPSPSLPAPTAASTSAGPSPCGDHASHQSRFYFVVFMNGSAPLFHSNRIPSDLLREFCLQKSANEPPAMSVTGASSPPLQAPSAASALSACAECEASWRLCAGRCGNPCQYAPAARATATRPTAPFVGDFAGNTVGMEEVPQQTLQSIAFPSSFASARTGPSLTRRTPGATRLTTPAPELSNRRDGARGTHTPHLGHSVSMESLTGAGRGGSGPSTSPGGAASQCALREPPFNLRLEEVRNTKGELRCCRLVATANFTTLVSSHTGEMHGMQSRQSAIALVITCPTTGQHYAFLQQHLKLIQALTYRVVDFGMRTMQRFFSLLLAGQRSGTRAQQMMRNVTATLERHQEALETYYELKRHLGAALALCLPLPPLCVPRYTTTWGSGEASQVPRFFQQSFWAQRSVFPVRPSGRTAPNATTASQPQDALPSLSDYLFAAVTRLQQFSDAFTSAVAAGVLSVGTPDGQLQGTVNLVTDTSLASGCGSSQQQQHQQHQQQPSPSSRAGAVLGPAAVPSGSRRHVDPYEAFWVQHARQEKQRHLGKPPHPNFQSSEPPPLERRERSWRGLPTIGSLATVSATTSGRTSPISPLSTAPTTSFQTSWSTFPATSASAATGGGNFSASAVTGGGGRNSPLPQPLAGEDDRAGAALARATPQMRGQPPPQPPPGPAKPADGFRLGGERSGRVLIFTRDADLAWCLLVLSATLLSNDARAVFEGHATTNADRAAVNKWRRLLDQAQSHTTPRAAAAAPWLASVRESFATAFAGQTTSTVFVGVPIQWVPQEYSEAQLLSELKEDPFSPCNVVLVIAPRQLLCQRIALKKTLDSTTVLLEQTAKGVEVRSAAHPFQCVVTQTETVLPDALVDTLLRETVQLHHLSNGVVPCAAVLHDMQDWLERQSASAVESERIATSVSRSRSSLPSRYESRTSLMHSSGAGTQPVPVPVTPPPPPLALSQPRGASPSLPRALCRPEWLPSGSTPTTATADAGDESETALEQLLLPGSYPSTSSRAALLNTTGLLVAAHALTGDSGGTAANAPGTLFTSWSPGTSQLQQLLCMQDFSSSRSF